MKSKMLPMHVGHSVTESLRAHWLGWFEGYGTVMLTVVSLHVGLPHLVPGVLGPMALALAVLEVILLGWLAYARTETPEHHTGTTEH